MMKWFAPAIFVVFAALFIAAFWWPNRVLCLLIAGGIAVAFSAGIGPAKRKTKPNQDWQEQDLDQAVGPSSIFDTEKLTSGGRWLLGLCGAAIAFCFTFMIAAATSNPPDTCLRRELVTSMFQGAIGWAALFGLAGALALVCVFLPLLVDAYFGKAWRALSDQQVRNVSRAQRVAFVSSALCFGVPLFLFFAYGPVTPQKLASGWTRFEIACRGASPSEVP